MNLSTGISKWIVPLLGVVMAALVVNLVAQYRNMQPHAPSVVSAASAPSAREHRASSSRALDEIAKYDPTVHFGELETLDKRTMPETDRDPFGFEAAAAPVAKAVAPAPVMHAPAPPPPPPLKAVGYNELPGGGREAMITFNDDLEVVHEGDTIGTNFKVLKITPTSVTVEDATTQKTIELQFPQ